MRVVIGKGSCGIAAGAEKIERIFKKSDIDVSLTGCIGMCYNEPIAEVVDDKTGTVKMYVKVNEDAAAEIVKSLKGENNEAGKYEISSGDMDLLSGQDRKSVV